MYNQENIFEHKAINFKEIDTNIYTIKINSKNRNLERELNPFNFEIVFNEYQNSNDNRAIITSKFENIKKIQVPEILIPRYIPRDYMGEPFNGITPVFNTNNSVSLSYYPGINLNNTIISIYDSSGVETNKIEVLEIVDANCKTMYLVALQYNNPYIVSKYINVKSGLFSYLNINNNIFPITNINGNIITLDNTTMFSLPTITNNKLIIGDYYKNTILVDNSGNRIGITTDSIQILAANTYNFQFLYKNQYIEYQVNTNASTITDRKLFKITDITSKKTNTNLPVSISNTTVVISGIWTMGYPTGFNQSIPIWYNNNTVKISQFNYGLRDLLDEKIFYLNLSPFTPNKSVSTDQVVNDSFGVLFPSTQSKEYLFLKGEALEVYPNSNLQTTNKKIQFSLLDSNNKQIGEIYNSHFNLYEPNNISINSYLNTSPDVNIILKIEEINRKI